MVDRRRAYRQWRQRRLGLLLPVFAGALATQLWLAAGSSAPAWVRVVSLGSSGLILALIGYFLAQTLLCARLHARGNRVGARVLREQLAPSGRAALGAAALLAILNSIPYLIPASPEQRASSGSARRFRSPVPMSLPSSAPVLEPESLAPIAAEDAPGPVPSRPDVKPVLDGVPLHLAVEDAEPPPATTAALAFLDAAPKEPEPAVAQDEGDGFPRNRPDVQHGFQLLVNEKSELTIERLGLPRENDRGEWIPPEMSLEVTFLNGRGRGAEISIHLDVPIGPDESIRTEIAVARLPGNEYFEESASESWQRVTIGYSYRVAGHTRHAPFDLAFTIGISADRFRMEGPEGALEPGARLSPYVAVDAALWQSGTAGLILHAGYSIPVNVTGGSSGVLDLSATVRIDLTERMSVHAGYRYLALRLRDYENALIGSRSSASFSEDFTGPIIGIDLRF